MEKTCVGILFWLTVSAEPNLYVVPTHTPGTGVKKPPDDSVPQPLVLSFAVRILDKASDIVQQK